MGRFRNYIGSQLPNFSLDDCLPMLSISDYRNTSLWWLLSSISYCLVVKAISLYINCGYLSKAINEGIGPILWNVIGTLGITLLGFSVFFVRNETIHIPLARWASKLLSIAFEIGLLSFGLLIGNFMVSFPLDRLNEWKIWFGGVGTLVLVIVVLAMNTVLWTLSRISYIDHRVAPIMQKISDSNPLFIIAGGLGLPSLSILLLLMSR